MHQHPTREGLRGWTKTTGSGEGQRPQKTKSWLQSIIKKGSMQQCPAPASTAPRSHQKILQGIMVRSTKCGMIHRCSTSPDAAPHQLSYVCAGMLAALLGRPRLGLRRRSRMKCCRGRFNSCIPWFRLGHACGEGIHTKVAAQAFPRSQATERSSREELLANHLGYET